MVTRIGNRRRGHPHIAEWTEHRGLSDEKMASRIGVDRVTVTRWRTQQHRLGPEKISALAVALDIEPEELWRPPPPVGVESLDAMAKSAPDELKTTAADIVRRLVAGAGK